MGNRGWQLIQWADAAREARLKWLDAKQAFEANKEHDDAAGLSGSAETQLSYFAVQRTERAMMFRLLSFFEAWCAQYGIDEDDSGSDLEAALAVMQRELEYADSAEAAE